MSLLFSNFLKFLKESIRDLTPIILVVLFFQLVIIQKIPENWQQTSLWISIVALWLSIFLMWLKYGIFPIWEKLTNSFANKNSFYLLLLFWFLIGFSTSMAEPALYVITHKANIISNWLIDPFILRLIIWISVWFAISIWIFSILRGIAIHYLIIIWYIFVLSITYFTPREIVWLAYDLWWVTTSTITVPLVVAIWIWVSAISKHKNLFWNWFWLIACAALIPMFSVQLYGIYIYNFAWNENILIETINEVKKTSIFSSLFEVIRWVIPIILTIWFFQYIILKQKIPKEELKNIILWFIMVIFWLYFFILWLEMWLFNLWEQMAFQLTALDNNLIIYIFAFLIWFSTTMAEPTLIAIANKASEISSWKINAFILRIFVALWVWIWITIWAYRIIYWDFIHYYIIIWYLIVIFLTLFSPKHIIPIAYDSGWVTTSTITVPLVAALWLWLATNIPGRDPMIDWFWLIAFASLFPIASVLSYGIITKYIQIRIRPKYEEMLIHEEVEIETKKTLIQKIFKK